MTETGSDKKPTAADSRAEASTGPVQAGERGGFLGFVAHEMRNPLSTAMWSAELLVRLSAEDRGGARGEKLSGMCLRTLTRLRLLLEDFFLMERLEIRGLPLKREEVALAGALEQARVRAGVECAFPPLPDVSVPVDRSLLDRALEGLLAVAGRDCPVAVDLALVGESAEIRISGAPVAPDALATPTKATPSDPTGRSLAVLVAAAIAEVHGGHLRIDRDGYVLALPLAGEQQLPPGGEP
jgi:K+-sensing histidine kinase KdpD